jgi:methyl-accepting chemotaxis protein
MDEIVSQVQCVSALIGEITNAAVEQSSGIGQVNEAVTQMDHVTQQNAALVEQSAAAAASLKDQAARLTQAVSVFRLAEADVKKLLQLAAPSSSAPRPTPGQGSAAGVPSKPAAPRPRRADDDWGEF